MGHFGQPVGNAKKGPLEKQIGTSKKIRYLVHSAQREEEFLRFLKESPDGTWVVSDLRSKEDLRQKALQAQGFVLGHQLQRASEFWRMLLLENQPQLKIISDTTAKEIASHYWSQLPTKIHLAAWPSILACLKQLGPVWINENDSWVLTAWINEHPDAALRWGLWASIAKDFFSHLTEQNFILKEWTQSVLRFSKDQISSRQLSIDLGFHLGIHEAELLQKMSSVCDVTIYQPLLATNNKVGISPRSYRILDSQQMTATDVLEQDNQPLLASFKCLHFPDPIEECKFAVHQIKEWLQEGASGNELMIATTALDSYWACLHTLLQENKIPCRKPNHLPWNCIPEVALWLHEMRMMAQSFAPDTAESFALTNGLLSSEEFGAKFLGSTSPQDFFKRLQTWDAATLKIRLMPDPTTFDFEEFLVWATSQRHVPSGADGFENTLINICFEQPTELRLPLKSWIQILEQELGRREFKVDPIDENGIAVVKINEADLLTVKKCIFLGLSERSLGPGANSILSPTDLSALTSERGLEFDTPDFSASEADLEWFLQNPKHEAILSYPELDFQQEHQTPAQTWLMKNRGETRPTYKLDASFEMKPPLSYQPLALNTAAHTATKKISLSASSIQKYLQCPFVFFSEKIMGLLDPSPWDWTLDPRDRGGLVHGALERIFQKGILENLSYEQMDAILDAEKQSAKLYFQTDELWVLAKKKMIQQLIKFIEKEKAGFCANPLLKTIATEKAFEVEFRGHKIRGKIDRIDQLPDGSLRVIDYKTKIKSSYQPHKWFEENEIQMILYMWIVEKFLYPDQEVSVATYLGIKDLKETGFFSGECVLNTVPTKNSVKTTKPLDRKWKQDAFSQLEMLLEASIQAIDNDQFEPLPKDENQCPSCPWRTLCRAPHLN